MICSRDPSILDQHRPKHRGTAIAITRKTARACVLGDVCSRALSNRAMQQCAGRALAAQRSNERRICFRRLPQQTPLLRSSRKRSVLLGSSGTGRRDRLTCTYKNGSNSLEESGPTIILVGRSIWHVGRSASHLSLSAWPVRTVRVARIRLAGQKFRVCTM